jgi:Domain of unknown function (DUF4350)
MILLGICVVALGIGVLRLATQRTPMPTGSSYSTEALGAQALYEWSQATGATPSRLTEAVVDGASPPATLLVLQPESPIDPTARQAFETVPARGGTLILVGDSFAWLLYARALGITVEPSRSTTSLTTDGDTLEVPARYRVHADDATPLLTDANGDAIALRRPYAQGTLIVIATPELLLNEALRDDVTARFVYRQFLNGATTFAFDEVHHSFTPPDANSPVTVNQLLFSTAPGRAVVYAALLTFAFILLNGRRLGPALVGRGPRETRRTMYEHVQMLANLYRRSGQFDVLRASFAHHYQRVASRGAGRQASTLAEAVARIETARSDSDLISAVNAAQAESR